MARAVKSNVGTGPTTCSAAGEKHDEQRRTQRGIPREPSERALSNEDIYICRAVAQYSDAVLAPSICGVNGTHSEQLGMRTVSLLPPFGAHDKLPSLDRSSSRYLPAAFYVLLHATWHGDRNLVTG